MENSTQSIAFFSDEIPLEVFERVLKEKYSEYLISAEISSTAKIGRGFGEALDALFSNQIVIGVLSSIIWDTIKIGFAEMKKSFGAKPVATIKMKDATEIKLFDTLDDEEIQERIMSCLRNHEVQSIRFNS